MQSQIKWGILLIALGLVFTVLSLVSIPIFSLTYGIPLLVIGGALFIFRGREEIIEEAADRGDRE